MYTYIYMYIYIHLYIYIYILVFYLTIQLSITSIVPLIDRPLIHLKTFRFVNQQQIIKTITTTTIPISVH